MSWEVELWVKRQRTGDPVRKAVLLSIGNWIDPQNNWQVVSIRRLADETEVSERTVQRHIATLIEMGFLEREERQRPGGGSGWNAYRMRGYHPVRVSSMDPAPPEAPQEAPPEQAANRGDNLTPPGCQPVTGGGDTAVTPILKKDTTPPPAKAGPPKGPKPDASPKPEKGARLPDDWAPPPADQLPPVTRSIVEGWPAGAYAFEAEQFRAHWAAENGPRAVKRDWGKAWATWLGRAVPDMNRMAKQGQRFESAAKAELPQPVPCASEEARLIRERMLTVMGMVAWRQWFGPLRFEIDGQRLIIRNATGFVKDWITNHKGAELERAARPYQLHWIIERGKA